MLGDGALERERGAGEVFLVAELADLVDVAADGGAGSPAGHALGGLVHELDDAGGIDGEKSLGHGAEGDAEAFAFGGEFGLGGADVGEVDEDDLRVRNGAAFLEGRHPPAIENAARGAVEAEQGDFAFDLGLAGPEGEEGLFAGGVGVGSEDAVDAGGEFLLGGGVDHAERFAIGIHNLHRREHPGEFVGMAVEVGGEIGDAGDAEIFEPDADFAVVLLDDGDGGLLEENAVTGFAGAERVLGGFAITDVGVRADEAERLAVGAEHGAATGLDPFVRTVFAADAVIDVVGIFLAAEMGVHGGENAFAVLVMDAALPGFAVRGEFVGEVADDFLPAIGEVGFAGEVVLLEDAGVEAAHGEFPTVLDFAESGLGGAERSEVGNGDDDAGEVGLAGDGLHAPVHDAVVEGAVGAAEGEFADDLGATGPDGFELEAEGFEDGGRDGAGEVGAVGIEIGRAGDAEGGGVGADDADAAELSGELFGVFFEVVGEIGDVLSAEGFEPAGGFGEVFLDDGDGGAGEEFAEAGLGVAQGLLGAEAGAEVAQDHLHVAAGTGGDEGGAGVDGDAFAGAVEDLCIFIHDTAAFAVLDEGAADEFALAVLVDGGVAVADELGGVPAEEIAGALVGLDDDAGVGIGDEDGVAGLGEEEAVAFLGSSELAGVFFELGAEFLAGAVNEKGGGGGSGGDTGESEAPS